MFNKLINMETQFGCDLYQKQNTIGRKFNKVPSWHSNVTTWGMFHYFMFSLKNKVARTTNNNYKQSLLINWMARMHIYILYTFFPQLTSILPLKPNIRTEFVTVLLDSKYIYSVFCLVVTIEYSKTSLSLTLITRFTSYKKWISDPLLYYFYTNLTP